MPNPHDNPPQFAAVTFPVGDRECHTGVVVTEVAGWQYYQDELTKAIGTTVVFRNGRSLTIPGLDPAEFSQRFNEAVDRIGEGYWEVMAARYS